MKTIIVHIAIKAGMELAFIKETNTSRKASLNEDGCVSYEIFQCTMDETKFTLVETYKSDEAIDAHKSTEHFKTWRLNVEPMMAFPRIGDKFNNVNE